MRNCPALALVQPQEISNLGPSQRIEPVSCEDPHATRDHHNADNASNPKPEQAAMTPTRKYPVNVAHLHGCTRSPFPTACKHLRAALSRRIHSTRPMPTPSDRLQAPISFRSHHAASCLSHGGCSLALRPYWQAGAMANILPPRVGRSRRRWSVRV